MFKKILIANRGEIACRIMRTAKRMGIATVAVYSEADAGALHVREADEAVAIGPAASSESYLKIERIVDACRRTGADAVHPGYGFLSEKAAFAEALIDAGIAFIGPGPHAIHAMGDKIESKKLARAAGVSMVPGVLDVITDGDHAVQIARGIGYPVMIKASAGGGGKGMRIARSDAEALEGFGLASSEARSSFGDDRVFIEKYIEHPHHIEIQILADRRGTILYLGERECSLQRRHQKVIEEAPSPFLDDQTRRAMGEQAVALARAVDYASAGTVEFIVDAERNFYFLEMNTRLQVEHPVTELVTGLDLVEWMIRIAAGEKLPFSQSDIKLTGAAVEARIYAEDPSRGFLPSIGRLKRYRPPVGPAIRVDTGVEEGSEIAVHYDPMIAKLVTFGDNREAAIDAMADALDRFELRGPGHNIEFLSALTALPRFRAGDLTTNLIAEEFPGGFTAGAPPGQALAELLAVAAAFYGHAQSLHGGPVLSEIAIRVDGVNHPATLKPISDAGAAGFEVVVDGWTVTVTGDLSPGLGCFQGLINGRAQGVQLERHGRKLRLAQRGHAILAEILPPRAAELIQLIPPKPPRDMSRYLLSPMPGLLVSLAVAAGDPIKTGQPLATIEAMKMENILRAERNGRVKQIAVVAGSNLAVDDVIMEFGDE